MIVQPGFLDHWKTRRLVELTGDASAPLAVIRLWAFCQESRKWEFPTMTPTQLASVCHWENRKPACHVALAKAGFLDKLPKGFGAHAWHEHNSRLIHNWAAGEKGGRPAKDTKPNETGQNDKTLGEPLANPKRTLLRPDQIDKKDSPSSPPASPDAQPVGADSPVGGGNVNPDMGVGGLGGLVGSVTAGTQPWRKPTAQEVRCHMANDFAGAEKYAAPYLKAMKKSGWKDRAGVTVRDWRKHSSEYAAAGERNARGVGQ